MTGMPGMTDNPLRNPFPDLEIHPLRSARWPDLEDLFGSDKVCSGCWCMWWRIPRSQWRRQFGESNQQTLYRLVQEGRTPGLVAYFNGIAIGWVSLEPRAGSGSSQKDRRHG